MFGVFTLEGGYHLGVLSQAVLNTLHALLGEVIVDYSLLELLRIT
jgi:hypothetical protein